MSDVICNPLDNGLTALSAVLANLQALPSPVSRLAVTQVLTVRYQDIADGNSARTSLTHSDQACPGKT